MRARQVGTLLVALLWPCVLWAQAPSFWPWQLLSGGYDSAVNDGRILHLPDETYASLFFKLKEQSLMTMSADNGGLSRSAPAVGAAAQPGDVWENVNGGRGFTDLFCGGYSEDMGCPKGGGAAHLGAVLGGPPGTMDRAEKNHKPLDVAAGGWPAALKSMLASFKYSGMCLGSDGTDRCAGGIVYRTGDTLFASPDAGRQWYPLSSQCGLPWAGGPRLVAVDPAIPGHVVTYTGPGLSGDAPQKVDAGACSIKTGKTCGRRAIAWTSDLSAQLKASFVAAASPSATDTTHAVDKAGGADSASGISWRYTSLGHLSVAQLDAQGVPGTCNAELLGIKAGCLADKFQMCHARRPPDAPTPHDRFCPNYDMLECKCIDTDTAGCTEPDLLALTIDPRNGHVYASGPAGLLVSTDGGGQWQRRRAGTFTRYSQSAPQGVLGVAVVEPWPYSSAAPTDPGVRLLTLQGLAPLPAGLTTGQVDERALDLNAQPEYLVRVGRVGFSFQPCPTTPAGPLVDAMGQSRPRGQLTATVTATWRNPLRPTQELSGVFVATADTCDPANDAQALKPLAFRDTANLMPNGASLVLMGGNAGVDAGNWRWSQDQEAKALSGQGVVKLPQSETRHMGIAFKGDHAWCQMYYSATAVAPSDSRVLYAWGAAYPPPPAELKPGACRTQTGLWRSLDRGATWHLALGWSDPQAIGLYHLTSDMVLSVSPTDPYRVMATAQEFHHVGGINQEAYEFRRAKSGQVYAASELPSVDCSGCAEGCPNAAEACSYKNDVYFYQLGQCRKDRAHPDLCEKLLADKGIAPGQPATFSCQRSAATGVARCDLRTSPIAESKTSGVLPGACLLAPPWAWSAALPASGETTWEPITTLKATAPCAACDTAMPPANWQSPAPACCLLQRSYTNAPGRDDRETMVCTPAGKAPYRQVSRGNSGGSVWTIAAVGDKFVVGEDDHTSAIKGMAPPATLSTGTTYFHEVAQIPTVVKAPASAASPANTRAYLATVADPASPDDVAWSVTSGDGADQDYLRLVRLGGLNSVTPSAPLKTSSAVVEVLPTLISFAALPNPVKLTARYDAKFLRGEVPGHVRLHAIRAAPRRTSLPDPAGSRNLLVASIPGVGVLVTGGDTKFVADVAAGQPLAQLYPKFAVPIPFEDPAAPTQTKALGLCVANTAVVGSKVYAAVGPAKDERCVPLTPGLYEADVRGAFRPDGTVELTSGVFKRMALHDAQGGEVNFPFAVALSRIRSAAYLASGQTKVSPSLLVGEWGSWEGGWTGAAGVWLVHPGMALAVKVAEIGTAHDFDVSPEGDDVWISALGARGASLLSDWDSSFLGLRPTHPDAGYLDKAKLLNNIAPGVYRLRLVPGEIPAAPVACAHWSAVPHQTTNAPDCIHVAGARAAQPSTGVANAGYMWNVLVRTTESVLGDIAVGAMYGQGAYWLAGVETVFPEGFLKADISVVAGHAWLPPWVPVTLNDLQWRARYADAYFKTDTAAPVGRPSGVAAWLADQLEPAQPGNLWQRVRLPATVFRDGLAGIGTAPGDLRLAFAHDDSGPAVQLASTADGWSFALQGAREDVLAAARVRIELGITSVAGAARFLLNGEPIGPALPLPEGRSAFAALTGALREGNNALALQCEGGPCSAEVTGLKTALGKLDQVSFDADGPTRTATAWLHHESAVARRHTAWMVIELADPNLATWARWNDGPWQPVQDGHAAAGNIWRVAAPDALLLAGPNRLEFSVSECPQAGCPNQANVVAAAVLLEYAEDSRICVAQGETCGDGADNDCDGATDESAAIACDSAGDSDGCALGRLACDGSTCAGDRGVPMLQRPPSDFVVQIASYDMVFVDGGVVHISEGPGVVNLLHVLTNGAHLHDIDGLTSPNGGTSLRKIVLHLAEQPSVQLHGQTVPVDVRHQPTIHVLPNLRW